MRAELRRAIGTGANAVARAWLSARGAQAQADPADPGPAPDVIAVVELSRLGDAVQAMGCVASLRARHPGARIALAVDERFAELFTAQPGLDAVWPVASGPAGLGALRSRMERERVELAFAPSPSTRNTVAVHGSRARLRVGPFDLRSSATPYRDESWLLVAGRGAPPRLRALSRGLSLPRRADAALAAVGCGPSPAARLEVAPAARDAVRRWLAVGEGGGGPLLLVHPGATWRHRTWSPRRWARAVARLVEGLDARVVLAAAGADAAVAREVAARSGTGPPRLFLDRPLGELAALLAEVDAFLGADSGPLHVAAAVGAPAVGLFGPASPELTAPIAEQGRWLHVQVPCSPCAQRRCLRVTEPCVERIEPADVLRAVGALLSRG